MPKRIGQGLRNLRANSSAKSCVLSPISASATIPVEIRNGLKKSIRAGPVRRVGHLRASAWRTAAQPGPGRRAKGLAKSSDRPGHGDLVPSVLTGPLLETQAATPQWAGSDIEPYV